MTANDVAERLRALAARREREAAELRELAAELVGEAPSPPRPRNRKVPLPPATPEMLELGKRLLRQRGISYPRRQ